MWNRLPISETKTRSPCFWRDCGVLEYRGYDSSGMAVLNGKGLEIQKKVGRIQQLERELATHPLHGTLGISHTSWATHGKPTDLNAHPHVDASGKLAIVHNGVIENYGALKKKLQEKASPSRRRPTPRSSPASSDSTSKRSTPRPKTGSRWR